DSLIGKLLKSYEETTLGSLPPATHPAQLDAWPAQEGGCSKTSEILCALEVLNFHRWLCGVPRLLLDDFLQDVVDVILQALKKRDERPLSKVRTSLEAFSQDLEDFTICGGLTIGASAARAVLGGGGLGVRYRSIGAEPRCGEAEAVRALAALGREFAVLHMEVLASLAARSDLDVQVRVAAAKGLGAAFTVSGGASGAAAATICRVLVQDAEERVREAMVEALGFFLESMPVDNSNTNNTNNNSPEDARAQCAAEAAAAEASVVAALVSCLRSDASWTVREAA
ncbi:unnamed protein product, partial [Polarella glacialis]